MCLGLRIGTLDGGGIHGARARLELRRGGGAPRHDDERVAVRVGGAGFRVQGSVCRNQSSGFRVQGSGFKVQGSRFQVEG